MTEKQLDLLKYNSPGIDKSLIEYLNPINVYSKLLICVFFIATGYDVLLAELSKTDDSKHEKILKVFEIFDKVIPLLGFYAEIMRTIKRELLGWLPITSCNCRFLIYFSFAVLTH